MSSKYCCNCIHYNLQDEMSGSFHICKRSPEIYIQNHGLIRPPTKAGRRCVLERESRSDDDCGVDGRYYQERKKKKWWKI